MSTNVLLSQPKISGTIRQAPFYKRMTIGETAPLLLIGHADADEMYTPYRITSMREAVNWLQADSSSPLLRAALEAYNIGCRDIWLYAAGPMSEYRSDISVRNTVEVALENKTFYELYSQRLQAAYDILKEFDVFQIVTPVEASFAQTSDIDFATPLAQFCEDVFVASSQSVLGVLGTRATEYDQILFNDMATDSVFDTIGEKGRYIMVVAGEGVIVSNQMSTTYSGPLATQTAALMCTTPLSRSIYGIPFRNTVQLAGFDLTDAQIDQLTQSKINPVFRTQRGKRGQNFQTMLKTDNTLAPDSSNFWSMNQMRVLNECVNTIKQYGSAYVGTTAFENFKQTIFDYFKLLVRGEFIKDFTLNITPSPRTSSVTVDVGIVPVFGIRNIYFTVETGAGS